MNRLNIILILFSLLSFQSNAQVKRTLTRQEAYSYSNLVGNYLDANDTGTITKTELVMVFLECDTIGRVTKIHLMSENQEEKSLYGVLKGITPEYFNSKRVITNAKDKTIIFPIYSMRYWADDNNYLDKMRTPSVPFYTDDMSATVREGINFIHVNGTTHLVGVPKMEKPVVCNEPDVLPGKYISDKQAIYSTLISDLYQNSPASIVITDSTVDSEITKTNFFDYSKIFSSNDYFIYFDKKQIDSTWISTFFEAEKRKRKLVKSKLPVFTPKCIYVRFINSDSIKLATINEGHWGFEKVFKVRDRLTLSNIILIDNRAFVEVSRICGSLCGEGILYFFEKRNGKWVVVIRQKLWIS